MLHRRPSHLAAGSGGARRLLGRLPWGVLAGGALLLGAERGLAQPRVAPRPPGPDVYAGVVQTPTSQPSTFGGLGLPTGQGLAASGRFEVTLFARLFTDGRFTGVTRYQASDGARLLIVLRARAKVLGAEHTRDVVLTLRPSGDDQKLLFSGRMVREVDDATLAAVKAERGLDRQIDVLLEKVGDSEQAGGSPPRPESLLGVDRVTADKVELHRLKSDGKRAEPVVLERKGSTLELRFKSYALALELGR